MHSPRTAVAVVDEDAASRAVVEGELRKRYGADYDVSSYRSAGEGLDALRAWCDEGKPVALVLASLRMSGMSGVEFLGATRQFCPTAKRALLAHWREEGAKELILEGFALGQIDCHLARPGPPPDEAFHQVVAELLAEWAKAHAALPVVRIVGDQSSPRCQEMRDLLERHSIPFRFFGSDTVGGRAVLAEVGADDAGVPVVVLQDGRILADPTNREAADALGGRADLTEDTFDLVVVGAGPAGLAAAVSAASEGLRTLVVEREAIGGQAGTTSRIRNYMGFSRGVTGSDLAARAYVQALHFGAHFHVMRETVELRPGVPHHGLVLSDGHAVRSRAVVIATGVTYRRLGVPSLEQLAGRGVYYGPSLSEAPAMAGQHVLVVGAGNSGGQSAVHLARYASKVTMVVRGDSLAASMSDYLVREIRATPNIEVRFRTEAIAGAGERRLERVVLGDARTDTVEHVEAAALFVLIGGEPRTDWLPPEIARSADHYVLTGPDGAHERNGPEPLLLETSVPGVFAAGDVRHRSIKRVASAAGEGAMVVALVHEHLSRSSLQPARATTGV